MSIELYLAFILASVVLALTPGPAMSLIIANGAAHGRAAGLVTVAGNSLGLGLLVLGAVLGMSSVMSLMADWFDLVRWAGAAYLIWLGVSRLTCAFRRDKHAVDAPENIPHRRWFGQGLVVALSNPKVLLFLGAFFPQFVDPLGAVGEQFVLLAVTFLGVVILIDSSYALLAGAARGWFTDKRMRLAEGISGCLLIGGGLWLALARRA